MWLFFIEENIGTPRPNLSFHWNIALFILIVTTCAMISAEGRALYFQIIFPVNVHAVDRDFHCLIYEACRYTSTHLFRLFQVLHFNYSVLTKCLYFCWFCTWFTVDCVEIVIILFWNLWLWQAELLFAVCALCIKYVFRVSISCRISVPLFLYGSIGGCRPWHQDWHH